MGKKVCLVDSARQCAVEAERVLYRGGLLNTKKTSGAVKFFVSDAPEKFIALGRKFLGSDITCIKRPEDV